MTRRCNNCKHCFEYAPDRTLTCVWIINFSPPPYLEDIKPAPETWPSAAETCPQYEE